jgi:hypothetical protein
VPNNRQQLDRLDEARDDIAAALNWLAGTDPGRGLRIAAGLWRFWQLRRGLDEGRRLLERLLAATPPDVAAADLVSGLVALGSIAYWQHDLPAARSAYEQARSRAVTAGDAKLLGEAEFNLGFVVAAAGRRRAGGAALFRAAHDRFGVAGDAHGRARAQEGWGCWSPSPARTASPMVSSPRAWRRSASWATGTPPATRSRSSG